MSTLDIALLILGSYFIIRGLLRGLSGEILSLAATIGGVYCAMVFSAPLARKVLPEGSVNPMIATVVTMVLIYGAIMLLCTLLERYSKQLIKITRLGKLNAILGGVAGFCKLYIVAFFILIATSIFFPAIGEGMTKTSYVMHFISDTLPLISPLLEEGGIVTDVHDMRSSFAGVRAKQVVKGIADDGLVPNMSQPLQEKTAAYLKKRSLAYFSEKGMLPGNDYLRAEGVAFVARYAINELNQTKSQDDEMAAASPDKTGKTSGWSLFSLPNFTSAQEDDEKE